MKLAISTKISKNIFAITGSISRYNSTLTEAQHVLTKTHTHKCTPSCYYHKPESLSHISICIHINVKAAELLATPMNSHYQSIWTGLSSAGTGPKSNSTLSTSSNSFPRSVPNRHHLLLTKKKKYHLVIKRGPAGQIVL